MSTGNGIVAYSNKQTKREPEPLDVNTFRADVPSMSNGNGIVAYSNKQSKREPEPEPLAVADGGTLHAHPVSDAVGHPDAHRDPDPDRVCDDRAAILNASWRTTRRRAPPPPVLVTDGLNANSFGIDFPVGLGNFDPSLFNGDSSINLERDFAAWFDPENAA